MVVERGERARKLAFLARDYNAQLSPVKRAPSTVVS